MYLLPFCSLFSGYFYSYFWFCSSLFPCDLMAFFLNKLDFFSFFKDQIYRENVLLISFKFYLFIYLWLCWVFVSARGLSPVVASGGHSSSQCAGLPPSRPLPFDVYFECYVWIHFSFVCVYLLGFGYYEVHI